MAVAVRGGRLERVRQAEGLHVAIEDVDPAARVDVRMHAPDDVHLLVMLLLWVSQPTEQLLNVLSFLIDLMFKEPAFVVIIILPFLVLNWSHFWLRL